MNAASHRADARRPSLLLVDDDPGMIQLLARALAGVGELRFATSGTDALRLARVAAPDLVLLDAEMPGMSGFELFEALKEEETLDGVPVIFVTGHAEPAFEVAGFERGAADFIAKPVNPALVLARVQAQLRVKRMADELRRVAAVDALSGLANRRRFDDALRAEWRRARRQGEPLALLLADVDHFKLYNDRYGHPAGDACLRSIAQVLAGASQRPADVAARYGGEEFALLLPDTPRAGAQRVAQRILDAAQALALPHAGSPTSTLVSLSVGIGCYDDESACWMPPVGESRFGRELQAGCSAADVLAAADAALYAAKNAGRAQAWRLDVADLAAASKACRVDLSPHRGGAGGSPP